MRRKIGKVKHPKAVRDTKVTLLCPCLFSSHYLCNGCIQTCRSVSIWPKSGQSCTHRESRKVTADWNYAGECFYLCFQNVTIVRKSFIVLWLTALFMLTPLPLFTCSLACSTVAAFSVICWVREEGPNLNAVLTNSNRKSLHSLPNLQSSLCKNNTFWTLAEANRSCQK